MNTGNDYLNENPPDSTSLDFISNTDNPIFLLLAQGITNFLLGLYVLKTGKWYFW